MKLLLAVSLVAGALLAADINRGIDLYKQGKYAEAESELRDVVGVDETNARAHQYLGFAYLEQKQFDEAAQHLNRAAEIAPGGDARAALARFYAEKREFDRAQAQLEATSGPNAQYARGLIQLDKKQYKEAAANIDAFLKENPNNGYAHYYAGLAYNGMGRKDRMLTEFELFLRIQPDAPEARKVRAVLQTGR